MNYFVKRADQQYGPYSLADLQLYVQQGHISPTDLARSEGIEEWLPVSQIIGNIPIAAPVATGFGAMGPTGIAASPVPVATGNAPPELHWGVLLALSLVTCTFFGIVWMFIEAVYVRKLRKSSNALLYLSLYVVGLIGTIAVSMSGNRDIAQFSIFLRLASSVFYLCAAFSMRASLEEYYNDEENIGLDLSGVMTFFFAVYYFQYHFNRINQWKRTGVLLPQA